MAFLFECCCFDNLGCSIARGRGGTAGLPRLCVPSRHELSNFTASGRHRVFFFLQHWCQGASTVVGKKVTANGNWCLLVEASPKKEKKSVYLAPCAGSCHTFYFCFHTHTNGAGGAAKRHSKGKKNHLLDSSFLFIFLLS